MAEWEGGGYPDFEERSRRERRTRDQESESESLFTDEEFEAFVMADVPDDDPYPDGYDVYGTYPTEMDREEHKAIIEGIRKWQEQQKKEKESEDRTSMRKRIDGLEI